MIAISYEFSDVVLSGVVATTDYDWEMTCGRTVPVWHSIVLSVVRRRGYLIDLCVSTRLEENNLMKIFKSKRALHLLDESRVLVVTKVGCLYKFTSAVRMRKDEGGFQEDDMSLVKLDTVSDASADPEEVAEEGEESDDGDEGNYDLDFKRVKRRKVELTEGINPQSSSSQGEPAQVVVPITGWIPSFHQLIFQQCLATRCPCSLPKKNMCPHPGVYAGMCMRCGQKMDDESGVAFGYIHKNLRLANDEIARLRDKDLKNLLRHKKLCLVLDLDHTLLNSARLPDITVEEGYLSQRDALPDALKSSLFRLDRMHMMTKLRPFVHTFLREASNLFEMYIYTMGERPYALEMAKLLDPGDVYFNSRIIAQGDCTQRYQKGLDVVLGQESAVLILDDTEAINYVSTENCSFLLDFVMCWAGRSDESESDGALATVLKVLQRVHSLFFDPGHKDHLEDRDVRQVLKTVRKEILEGCKVVFSRVFPTNFPAEEHHLWKMAEQLGATCSLELDPSVTHVVSMDAGTDKSHWAVQEKKFLVHPRWIEASNYMWQKQPEDNFPVSQAKNK
ncbi:RNA polymerase II C-terminal domain phosphatase-like 4 [Sesamum angolense]|uniref:RNA polymerase II C-terminal domain phosphatase-like n=1 Tax=Sesamum angolense TaxID=2727404 RepID=A0AAE1WG75_9LAMI|nr:RNA polymerase II C-terminal domain phosphatase-like 4 [Sesamum angolense]